MICLSTQTYSSYQVFVCDDSIYKVPKNRHTYYQKSHITLCLSIILITRLRCSKFILLRIITNANLTTYNTSLLAWWGLPPLRRPVWPPYLLCTYPCIIRIYTIVSRTMCHSGGRNGLPNYVCLLRNIEKSGKTYDGARLPTIITPLLDKLRLSAPMYIQPQVQTKK